MEIPHFLVFIFPFYSFIILKVGKNDNFINSYLGRCRCNFSGPEKDRFKVNKLIDAALYFFLEDTTFLIGVFFVLSLLVAGFVALAGVFVG